MQDKWYSSEQSFFIEFLRHLFRPSRVYTIDFVWRAYSLDRRNFKLGSMYETAAPADLSPFITSKENPVHLFTTLRENKTSMY